MDNFFTLLKKSFLCYKKNALVSSLFTLEYIAISFLSFCFLLFFTLNYIIPKVSVGIMFGFFRVIKVLIKQEMPLMLNAINIAGFAVIIIYFISRTLYLRFIFSRTKTEENNKINTSFSVFITDIFLTLLNTLSFVLFIIPYFIISTRYKFTKLIIFDSKEKINIIHSLKKSAEMAKDKYFKIIIYSIAIFKITHLSLIFLAIIALLSSLFMPGILGDSFISKIIWTIIVVFYTVCMPLGYYINAYLYENIKENNNL